MTTATKKCRVCGNEYEYCHTAKRIAGVFRWQDVACCPEHGSIYLARIEASRATTGVITSNTNVLQEINDHIDGFDEEYDILFEEDFGDEEELAIITK